MRPEDSIALRVLRRRIKSIELITRDYCPEPLEIKLEAYKALERDIEEEIAKAESSQVSRESSEEIRF